jgi:hypothetical protein
MPASIRHSPLRFAFVLSAVFAAARAVAMITVGPASDAACQHHDIAAVLQAAAGSPGIDLIAISAGPWSAQTTITDHGDEMFLVALPPASFERMHGLLEQPDANPVQAYSIGAGVPLTVRDLGVRTSASARAPMCSNPPILSSIRRTATSTSMRLRPRSLAGTER